jgi:predicted nucleotide-binding protein
MSDAKSGLPRLTVSIQKAREQINAQIEKGREIRDRVIKSRNDLDVAWKDEKEWHNDNIRLLKVIFDNKSVADEYNKAESGIFFLGEETTLQDDINDSRKDLDVLIKRLEIILDEQERIYEIEQKIKDPIMNTTSKPKIFVVHGHDPIKDQLESLLLRWGFEPIILEDQANLGQTLIEKFEKNSDVKCAIVLLTPDDEGRPKHTDGLKPRARQNVILELGYFYGRLGRDKVICLYKSSVELPSDISGIVYISFRDNIKDEVYRKIRDELKAMGFTIND